MDHQNFLADHRLTTVDLVNIMEHQDRSNDDQIR